MRISISQLNFIIGDFEYNSDKIIKSINKAKSKNMDLVVFSELSICGYPPLDLLERKSFIENCQDELSKIASHCKDIAAIVGLPVINSDEKGKKLYNAAAFIAEGEVKKYVKKTLLPDYDIFDEYRYFEPNNEHELIEYKDKKIAITICEDLWIKQYNEARTNDYRELYKSSPLENLSKQKPDFVINIAASPFTTNKAKLREKVLSKKASKYNLPIIYVNQVGANTDLVFDGGSMVFNSSGEVVCKAKFFDEDFVSFNLSAINRQKTLTYTNNDKIASLNSALVLGLRDFFVKNNFSNAVIGLSGGIDSALTMAIAVQALGNKNLEVVLLPSKFSSQHSIDDSIEMAEVCNVKYHIVEIESARRLINENLKPLFADLHPDTTEENIQARLRGLYLMAFSNKFGHILLNTSNKSEAAVGYTTLYGDMSGSISVIGDMYKTEVYKLSNYINENIAPIIPRNIITKAPSAELKFDQKDSDSLPEYHILDEILYNFIELQLSSEEIINKGFDEPTVNRVISLVNNSEYKRYQAPPTIRVSGKSFGYGRKIPLTARFT